MPAPQPCHFIHLMFQAPPYQFTVYHSNSGFCTTSYLMIRCPSLDLRRRPGLKQAMADERNRQARQADFQHHQHSQGTCPGLPMNWRSTPSYHHSRLWLRQPKAEDDDNSGA
ncbi:hypothetical protein V8C43DRAFT_294981 [Trichoderma afarasin]